MPKTTYSSVLVSDFDGTMTRHDFYQLARARWWNPADPDPWREYLAGRMTHFDALNRFFARIRADESSLRAFAETMELDPTLAPSLARLHQAGWRIVIASAGCEWYIRHLLAGVATPFVLHANPGVLTPDGGLRMVAPTTSPFFSPETGINKTAVARDAMSHADRVAFAGDGPPDLPPARLVSPALRFARGHLASALHAEHQGFHPFKSWAQLADILLETPDV